MRKNQLIELLQQLKGNPEIVVWNGLVRDTMPIAEIQEGRLYKESAEFNYTRLECEYKEAVNNFNPPPDEVALKLQEQAKDITRKSKFEFPNPYVDPADYPKWYGKSYKKVCIIMPKVLGKSYEDRLGSITY